MNALIEYPIPHWISLFFMVAIPLPFILIARLIKKTEKDTGIKNMFLVSVLFFICYLSYILFASFNGWFKVVSLPPRVLLLATFPYAFFLFGYLDKTKILNDIINKVSIESLVQLHVFRVLGIFFLLLAFHDALPKPFALIAGFGDIITALSSFFVVKAIQDKKSYAAKLCLYWNFFGAADIAFIAIAANVLTKISIDTGAMGVDSLAMFPFCIIPAFAPPTILFLHWMIYKKLKKQTQ